MIKKAVLIFVGIILAFVIGEAALRLSGYLYYRQRMKHDKLQPQQSSRRDALPGGSAQEAGLTKVLCLGDSWTFGTGAAAGYEYPAQLQAILDRQAPGKYRVYNQGEPGFTSTKLLARLPGILDKYEPQIVVVLIGLNDMSNPFPEEIILLSGTGRRFYFRAVSFITGLRMSKAIAFCIDGARRKFISAGKGPHKQSPAPIHPESARCFAKGEVAYNSGLLDEAKEYFKKALEFAPHNEEALNLLGHLYQSERRFDDAVSMYGRIIDLNPYTPYREHLYRFLFLIYQDKSISPACRRKIISLVKKIASDGMFTNPGPPFFLRHKQAMKNLSHNLHKMNELIKSRQAVPIFQTYLRMPYLLYDELRGFRSGNSAVFVDNKRDFDVSEVKEYFAFPDDHPNAKGYNIIAENVGRKILILMDGNGTGNVAQVKQDT